MTRHPTFTSPPLNFTYPRHHQLANSGTTTTGPIRVRQATNNNNNNRNKNNNNNRDQQSPTTPNWVTSQVTGNSSIVVSWPLALARSGQSPHRRHCNSCRSARPSSPFQTAITTTSRPPAPCIAPLALHQPARWHHYHYPPFSHRHHHQLLTTISQTVNSHLDQLEHQSTGATPLATTVNSTSQHHRPPSIASLAPALWTTTIWQQLIQAPSLQPSTFTNSPPRCQQFTGLPAAALTTSCRRRRRRRVNLSPTAAPLLSGAIIYCNTSIQAIICCC